jgi:hypothetical protein
MGIGQPTSTSGSFLEQTVVNSQKLYLLRIDLVQEAVMLDQHHAITSGRRGGAKSLAPNNQPSHQQE